MSSEVSTYTDGTQVHVITDEFTPYDIMSVFKPDVITGELSHRHVQHVITGEFNAHIINLEFTPHIVKDDFGLNVIRGESCRSVGWVPCCIFVHVCVNECPSSHRSFSYTY